MELHRVVPGAATRSGVRLQVPAVEQVHQKAAVPPAGVILLRHNEAVLRTAAILLPRSEAVHRRQPGAVAVTGVPLL